MIRNTKQKPHDHMDNCVLFMLLNWSDEMIESRLQQLPTQTSDDMRERLNRLRKKDGKK